jgi:hypothetical protein
MHVNLSQRCHQPEEAFLTSHGTTCGAFTASVKETCTIYPKPPSRVG